MRVENTFRRRGFKGCGNELAEFRPHVMFVWSAACCRMPIGDRSGRALARVSSQHDRGFADSPEAAAAAASAGGDNGRPVSGALDAGAGDVTVRGGEPAAAGPPRPAATAGDLLILLRPQLLQRPPAGTIEGPCRVRWSAGGRWCRRRHCPHKHPSFDQESGPRAAPWRWWFWRRGMQWPEGSGPAQWRWWL